MKDEHYLKKKTDFLYFLAQEHWSWYGSFSENSLINFIYRLKCLLQFFYIFCWFEIIVNVFEGMIDLDWKKISFDIDLEENSPCFYFYELRTDWPFYPGRLSSWFQILDMVPEESDSWYIYKLLLITSWVWHVNWPKYQRFCL